jgi:hypothetical protein
MHYTTVVTTRRSVRQHLLLQHLAGSSKEACQKRVAVTGSGIG